MIGLSGLLYPEQENILNHWHQVKSISYNDETIALENILFSIVTAMSKNEKSIVILPSQEMCNLLNRWIDEFHITPICFYYDPNQSVTREDVELLQRRLIDNHDHRNAEMGFDEMKFFKEKYENELYEILSGFHAYDGGRNLITVLERLADISGFSNKNMVEASKYEWLPVISEAEFDNFYDQIVHAASLYQPQYLQEKQKGIFSISSSFASDENRIEIFISHLSYFIISMEALREEYFAFMHQTLVDHLAQTNRYYSIAKDKLEYFQFADHMYFEKKKSESSSGWQKWFGSKDQNTEEWQVKRSNALEELFESLSALPAFDVDQIHRQDFEKETFQKQKAVENLTQKMELWYKRSIDSQKSFFKYSNIFNQKESDYLQELEERLYQLVSEINQSGVIDKPLEINTLSLQKQTDLLNNYIKEFHFLIRDVTENKGYYIWQEFYQNASKVLVNTIDGLQHFPTYEWPAIIEFIFLRNWIGSRLSIKYDQVELITKKLIRFSHEITSQWCYEKSQQRLEQRNEALKNISGIEKSIIQKIKTNKDLDKLNWRYFFEQNVGLWGTLFDCIITPDDKFDDMETGHFTNLFYLNPTSVNPEVLHHGKTIHTYYPSENVNCDLHLQVEKLNVESGVKTLQSLATLKIAKTLAVNFYALQQKFAIFQSRNANVISCLHTQINVNLFLAMNDSKFKEIQLSENPKDTLVESIIESSRKQYLLIHDGLLDTLQKNTYALQVQAIEDFRLNGFTVLNLQTPSLLEDYQEALDNFFDQILV